MEVKEIKKIPACKECVGHIECKVYDWEKLYVEHQMQFLKLIDKFADVQRLYLLMNLEFYKFNLISTLNAIPKHYKTQQHRALKITDFLKKSIQDADPIFLDLAGEWLSFKDDNSVYVFVELFKSGKKTVYPKLGSYQEKIKTLKLIKSLTVEFEVINYLEICPNPIQFIDNLKTFAHPKLNEAKLHYLYDRFNTAPVELIQYEFSKAGFNLLATVDAIEDRIQNHYQQFLESCRLQYPTGVKIYFAGIDDIDLLKEIAFVENKESIELEMITTTNMRIFRLEQYGVIEKLKPVVDDHMRSLSSACWMSSTFVFMFPPLQKMLQSSANMSTIMDLLYKCQCCYETELLQSQICSCPKGHTFCLKCIKKFVEIEVSFKKLQFKCMTECTEHLNLEMLKQNVGVKLCERLLSLEQAEDIKAANIEGLESCRFCDYAASVPQDLKVFSCLNPECGIEICRLCGERNHLPLTCDEIEKTPEVQVRIMIENKMSEVLIRVCPKCNNSFLKESGCNKMICTCGTRLCYICKKVIPSFYEHFYHDRILPDKCPLYTDDNVSHVAAVEAAARLIINELRETNPELLNKINIDKLLPNKQPSLGVDLSVSIKNEVIAKVLGENINKINNLKDLS